MDFLDLRPLPFAKLICVDGFRGLVCSGIFLLVFFCEIWFLGFVSGKKPFL